MRKPILSLDFDGVCHSYTSKWIAPEIIPDPPVEGLFPFLIRAAEHFRIAIYSTRSATQSGREAMQKWFQEQFALWCKAQDPELLMEMWAFPIEFPETKPPASVMIDDRAFCFEGAFPSIEWLKNFKPWNKK